ncbi:MAG: hypothetical protein R6W68_14600 [Ignavibacteriaceae bacterium]
MQSFNNGDWNRIASLIHPDASWGIRSLIEAFPENKESDKAIKMILNESTKEQAASLSDQELFARLMQFADQAKGLTESMDNAETRILGKVNEGEDTCHVLCRIETSVKGVPYRYTEVISMSRTPTGWGTIMKGDLTTMITALKQKFSNREN